MVAVVPNEVFSAFSFIAFAMCAVPLYWHLHAWNVGTCLFIMWTGLGSLIFFINSIIWKGNVINWAPVWCDIVTRFITGITVGIPATSLAINRRLYKISSVRAVVITRAERRREIFIDFAIGLGFPCIVMILQYVVQGHRFNIFEDIGCLPTTWNTHLAYVLVYMWPIVTGLISAGYCSMTIWNFYKTGRQMREVLSIHAGLNSSRYIRLMALASMELFATIPLASWVIWINSHEAPVYPWKSWADTHYGFSRIDVYPKALWSSTDLSIMTTELQRWLTISCAFVFFFFFGFADEARKHYRQAYTSVASRLGVTTTSGSLESTGFGSYPHMSSKGGVAVRVSTYNPTSSRQKRGSLFSVDQLSTSISLPDFYAAEHDGAVEKKEEFSPTDSTASSSMSDIRGLPHLHADAESQVSVPPPAMTREERHVRTVSGIVVTDRHTPDVPQGPEAV